ncbi:MAG: winged helix-turn-helix transcriptional regulator [Hadesarchaea archaeon]|nr:winged helix-turn-helix transcriptional regulator [Hadesarchaea archaeon]
MMNLRELAYIIILVILLQGSLTALFFGLQGPTPGLDFWTIGISMFVMIAISGSIALILYWLVNRYMKERAIRTAMMAMSEDEEKLLRIIMQEGKIRQDEIRRRVDFSKSKVSAIVNNLIDNNAITKTRYKRTNHLEPTEDFQK